MQLEGIRYFNMIGPTLMFYQFYHKIEYRMFSCSRIVCFFLNLKYNRSIITNSFSINKALSYSEVTENSIFITLVNFPSVDHSTDIFPLFGALFLLHVLIPISASNRLGSGSLIINTLIPLQIRDLLNCF